MTSAPCNLCQRGIREEFTAKIDGKEYVRCKNKMCGFFCPVAKFEEYEDLVDSRVGKFYKGVDAPKRAKAWCPTNCGQCRIYTRFF